MPAGLDRSSAVGNTLAVVSTSTILWLVLVGVLLAALVASRTRRGIEHRLAERRKPMVANRIETAFAGMALVATSLLTAAVAMRFEWPVLISWLVAANVAAFTTFGLDKLLAIFAFVRVPEVTLHVLALVGGTIGAYVAMDLFRHKISARKSGFRWRLRAIVLFQVAAVYLVVRNSALGAA